MGADQSADEGKALIGEFSQAAVRSSAAILGVALSTNIYGDAGMVPMMVLSAVPFFNVYAVLILQFSPHVDENGRLITPERDGGAAVKRALCNVAKKPDHPRHSAGRAVFAAARKTADDSFLDAQYHWRHGDARRAAGGWRVFLQWGSGQMREARAAGDGHQVVYSSGGFSAHRGDDGLHGSAMIAILIMVGSPMTVSCYVMAKNMGYKGVLTSSVVMLATVLSSVSLTLWIFLLRLFGLL